PAPAPRPRSGFPAAATARSARTPCGATTAASRGLKAATPPSSTPARRSSSRRRRLAVTDRRRAGRSDRRTACGLAHHRIFHGGVVALPIERVVDGNCGAVGQRQDRAADRLVFGGRHGIERPVLRRLE